MDATSARALQLLTRRPYSLPQLAEELKTSYSRTASITSGLVEKGYAERTGRILQLVKTAKADLAKSLSGKYNLETLLADAQGRILLTLREPKNVETIASETGLSQSAIYTALQRLSGIGAVTRVNSRYQLADDPDLTGLASILVREERAAGAEPFATVLKTSKGHVLKRVFRGIQAKGSLTGFSLFPRLGIEYSSPYVYYVDPSQKPSLESVLVHALASSGSRTDTTICAIFIAKNKARLDPEKTRRLAEQWDVLQLWLDASRLAEGKPPENPDKFLPWKEYVEKAELYELSTPKTEGSEQSLALLNQIGTRISSPAEAYLFGGGNMLLGGLKAQTKDIDLILEDKHAYRLIVRALTALGFRQMAEKDMDHEDRRLEPSGIFVADDNPRVDLFTKNVLGKFVLTAEMKKRTEERRFQNLRLKLLSLEDVFLFKSITDRVGDLDDMAVIVRRTKPDWQSLLKTYWTEEKVTGAHFCFTILDNLEILQKREGIRVPIHSRLLQHCLDTGIIEAVKRGAATVKEVKKLVDFPEYQLRNRVRALIEDRKLKRQPHAKSLRLTAP
jgi:predicted transcriptional regulator